MMKKVLHTYDLKEKANESKHSEVKRAMKELGYLDTYTVENETPSQIWYLPNTTLWKTGITPDQAKTDMLNVVKSCNAVLERFKAVEYTEWAGIPGIPFK